MADSFGQILPYAIGVAISPVPIIGVILMLATPQARSNGPAFLLGWVVGLALLGTVVLLVSGGGGADAGDNPANWTYVLKLLLGLLLLVVAFRQWHGRPREGEPGSMPSWMEAVDRFTTGRSVALAVALSAVNPKNFALTVGAAASIAATGYSATAQAVGLVAFVVIASVGVAIPLAIYFLAGDRSGRMLSELRSWMSLHNAAIMAVLCLIIGAKLIGDAISGFAV
ncbi:MAG: GAP family protein [Solirubrobacterales bacterium]|nr:GAP family protein [Solirubrobacterales bacterium]